MRQKELVTTGILVFDFELFIGVQSSTLAMDGRTSRQARGL
jgi:hypothetical protein